jgi:hypothetical protein
MRRAKALLADIVLLLVTCVMCIAALELGFRAYSGVPLFKFANWRSAHVLTMEAAPFVQYDPVLGWTHEAYFSSPSFNTIAYGVRKNHPSDQTVRTGGILVVGDSFTAGSDVSDSESWPAQLEDMVDVPVINAAIGSYGIDQMMLRAEMLLPVVRPKVVVLGSEQAIGLVGYSSFAWSKPYFTLQDGKLVQHNDPVPPPGADRKQVRRLKRILGYSYLADQLMTKYDPLYWFSDADKQWTRVPIDEADVSCALLKRLKADVEAQDARLIVLLQHGGDANIKGELERDVLVARCAKAMGITVVDEYETLHVLAQNPQEFASLYHRANPSAPYGHMTAKGNRIVAGLVAAAVRQAPPPISAERTEPEARDPPGDTRNLLLAPEVLGRNPPPSYMGKLSETDSPPGRPVVYTLLPLGATSEHFVRLPITENLPAGVYTFSLQARTPTGARLRLQLLDGKNNGAAADYDFDGAKASIDRVGDGQHLAANVEQTAEGWYQVSLTVLLPQNGAHVFVQLLDHNGGTVFAPADQAVELRDLQVEAGGAVSVYNATGAR